MRERERDREIENQSNKQEREREREKESQSNKQESERERGEAWGNNEVARSRVAKRRNVERRASIDWCLRPGEVEKPGPLATQQLAFQEGPPNICSSTQHAESLLPLRFVLDCRLKSLVTSETCRRVNG